MATLIIAISLLLFLKAVTNFTVQTWAWMCDVNDDCVTVI